MELRTATIGVARVPVCQRIMDYLELAKARLVLMILVVTMVGFYMGRPAYRTGDGCCISCWEWRSRREAHWR